MKNNWGVVGCAYMGREYTKVLLAKGITPQVYSRDLSSKNVTEFRALFPDLPVHDFARLGDTTRNWLVCTSIESHDDVCRQLRGSVYCEKPFGATADYDTSPSITMLMNRRYYYWVDEIMPVIDQQKIVKIIATIPEKHVDDVMARSIHVIDLLWYLAGAFGDASKIGSVSPTYIMSTAKNIALVINLNYKAHENFSVKFYAVDGTVFEARPLEWFSTTDAMEVRAPDDDLPIRTYRPVSRALPHSFNELKPGLEALIDDLLTDSANRLPSLAEHQPLQAWMEKNLL